VAEVTLSGVARSRLSLGAASHPPRARPCRPALLDVEGVLSLVRQRLRPVSFRAARRSARRKRRRHPTLVHRRVPRAAAFRTAPGVMPMSEAAPSAFRSSSGSCCRGSWRCCRTAAETKSLNRSRTSGRRRASASSLAKSIDIVPRGRWYRDGEISPGAQEQNFCLRCRSSARIDFHSVAPRSSERRGCPGAITTDAFMSSQSH
jgi:hypothetical protein